MITSILEFFFSNHYLYDNDNRFYTRIKNAKILNKLTDNEKADVRLKKALYYYGLEMLQKISIAQQPIGMVFGNIYFRDNGRLIPAELEIDNDRKGNVYVAIIKEQTVITLILLPINVSNEEIINKIKSHDGTEIVALYDMDKNKLNLNDKKRKNIVIDLDINDSDFNKEYSAPVLTDYKGISDEDMKWINQDKNNKPIFSINAIPNTTEFTAEKEFVINKGTELLIRYGTEFKSKIVDEIIIDTTGNSKKYSLRLKNTLKLYDLTIGTKFIISPTQKTENYLKLLKMFNIDENSKFHVEGNIIKFMDYSFRGRGLGIVIKPQNIINN